MDWDECEVDFIREVEVDEERIKSLIKKAEQRLKIIKLIKLSEETVSFIVEGYYEVIKELLVAYLLKNGLKSKNHQCLISYFYKQNPSYEKEAYLISEMSYYRNRLDYYGESVPLDFYEKNKLEFQSIIKILTELIQQQTQGSG